MEVGGRVTVPSDFGTLLRRHRLAAELSQEALAERARISANGLGALERGYRRNPQRETVALLARALALDDAQRRDFEAAASRRTIRHGAGEPADPLRNLPAPNLPLSLTTFVGRHAELGEIATLVRAHRLITLTGAGGIGKTQTALRAAASLRDGFSDGVRFVGFAPINDPSLLPATIASALDVPEVAERSLLESVKTYLKNRTLLLVFDNCEHVVEDAAAVATAVLLSCPGVRILATSREPLRAAGEHVYRLRSLDAASAVALFADRAQAVDHTFQLTGDEMPVVAEICRRLDGIPLAIELAAARTNLFSPAALASKLDDRFRILVGGERAALRRQQTMHATIEWSYDLLSTPERHVFECLSVFAGGCTVDSAIAVCSDGCVSEDEVLAVLSSLVDKSLLIADLSFAESRFFLPESFRQFGRERLDARGETCSALDRHARFFSEVADRAYVEWDTVPAPDWLARAASDIDNVRAALELTLGNERDPVVGAFIAGSYGPTFMRLSLLGEGVDWCERALQFADRLSSHVAARLNYVLSMLYHNQGANARALMSARRAVELYQAADDERGLIRALSQVAHHLGNAPDEAQAVAEDALSRARRHVDPRLLAATLQRCAFAYPPEQIEAARANLSEAVGLFRALGRDDETARALTFWADAESMAGNFELAVSIAREALELGSADGRLYTVLALASLYSVLEDRERATPARARSVGARLCSRAPARHFSRHSLSRVGRR